MSLVRFLPAWLHAVADYAVAFSLIAVALIVGGSGKAVATGVVIGAVVLVVSLLTRYPLGVIKVLPFKLHSAADYLAVVLLGGAPFALHFDTSARGLSIFYLAAGGAVLLVSLITNYQYSPKGQGATVRTTTATTPAAPDRGDADRWFSAAAKARQPLVTAPAAWPEPAAESWRSEPVSAGAASSGPVAASRPLREILAERAAGRESAA